ncbi:16161_t:CDS:2 [Cetraspora pellucida]|uniref:16161_t:CDS:1 n=1 Tax=Cetraspora pellucida TaxID=1433469 RepID=A0A9N9JYI2_9GLOM|nr:16161_t:CDS:2 [Cetraspora pellucida]
MDTRQNAPRPTNQARAITQLRLTEGQQIEKGNRCNEALAPAIIYRTWCQQENPVHAAPK